MGVTLEGTTAARDALRRMPRELKTAVRDEVTAKVAAPLAAAVSQAGMSAGRYGAYVAPTARAKKDVEPLIVVGAARKAVSGGARVNELLYGAEFGSPGNKVRTYGVTNKRGTSFSVRRRTTRQFMPAGGHSFILDTFARRTDETYRAWEEAAFAPMLALWGGGAGG